jgi:hypothetical protein
VLDIAPAEGDPCCMASLFRIRGILVLAAVAAGCGGGGKASQNPDAGDRPPPGTPVGVTLPADRQAELDQLQAAVAATDALTADQLTAARALPFAALGYDPTQANNYGIIQASALKLNDAEQGILRDRGFVISRRQGFPTFTWGYSAVYAQDLPVFVSADSILYAVHQSFDAMLAAIEKSTLVGDVQTMLDAMRARLVAGEGGDFGDQGRRDADLYLAVAESLLAGSAQAPVAGASAADVSALFSGAMAAEGAMSLFLFGMKRNIDFSQFTPRGHYKGDPVLERYFRAMIWLGRIDFPIIEYTVGGDGTVQETLHRDLLAAAFALGAVMDDTATARWQRIDAIVGAFVGEHDAMTPPQLTALQADLGIGDATGLAAKSDDEIVQAIVAGGYGQQRISSQIVISPPHAGTLPLAATFLLMGQRYVVDSHVFSNVVYDRVNHPGAPPRMLPDPLDVAYAALHNDQAAALLATGLARYGYAPELERMRILVDAHGDDYWSANLYNSWLGALRALSPSAAELGARAANGLPAVAGTEAWGRRLLNTQLASWAELRHDTILYVKQSYSAGSTCEFPDAYVEPSPEFFARIGALAAKGSAVVQQLPSGGDVAATYFAHLGDVAAILQRMAEHQRTGAAQDAADLAFINDAVKASTGGCGPPSAAGWYPRLFYGGTTSDLTFDPTIADVHTAPTDEAGNPVGNVLHVATWSPRLMVVTFDTCTGPRAYAGPVSSYFEITTRDYQRLDDQTWSKMTPPADVAWMTDLIGQ